MKDYERALVLLEEAARLMDEVGDTLIAAHIATPIDIVHERIAQLRRSELRPNA